MPLLEALPNKTQEYDATIDVLSRYVKLAAEVWVHSRTELSETQKAVNEVIGPIQDGVTRNTADLHEMARRLEINDERVKQVIKTQLQDANTVNSIVDQTVAAVKEHFDKKQPV